MGNLDRLYDQSSDFALRLEPAEMADGVVRFPAASSPTATTRGCGAALDLVCQAAEVIKGIENYAAEAEKSSVQKLYLAQKRIEELEAELRASQVCISDARMKLKEADSIVRAGQARLEAAEKKMCDLEMRARVAETQAKENANAVARIEDAIRTQILANRLPPNKLVLSA